MCLKIFTRVASRQLQKKKKKKKNRNHRFKRLFTKIISLFHFIAGFKKLFFLRIYRVWLRKRTHFFIFITEHHQGTTENHYSIQKTGRRNTVPKDLCLQPSSRMAHFVSVMIGFTSYSKRPLAKQSFFHKS